MIARWWRPALLVTLAGLVYLNGLRVPFALDDLASIADNPQIRGWTGIGSLFSTTQATAVAGRPLAILSLAFNYWLGGLNVVGYHLLNLAVHVACGLLLFAIVWRTLDREPGGADVAFAAALLWIVHPLNTETIDYVVQRTESLMALCCTATLYASIRAREDRSGRRRWEAVAVAACAAGMFAKESMASAPLLVVLYDRTFGFGTFGRALRSRWTFYAPLAATSIIAVLLASQGARSESVGFGSGVSPWTYLLNQAVLIPRYLALTVWPRSLVALYGWPAPFTVADVWPWLVAMAALVVTTLVALVRWPRLGFLGAWFFVTLAPSSSVIPIATEVGAERRMYLPLMAVAVLVAVGLRAFWRRVVTPAGNRDARADRFFLTTVGLMTLALGVRTLTRNAEYASPVSLARTIVERRPTAVAHHLLGQELIVAGQREDGVAELRLAVDGDSKARYMLGLELFNQGRPEEAIQELTAFLETAKSGHRLVPHWLEPTRAEILTSRDTVARAYGLLGDRAVDAGQLERAVDDYTRYLAGHPDDVNALMRLGATLAALNRSHDAVDVFQRAVKVAPASAGAHRNLAMALFDARNAEAAEPHAREAVRLNPTDAGAHDLLGRVLAVRGDLAGAASEFRRALEIDPNEADARADLARLAALRGRLRVQSP